MHGDHLGSTSLVVDDTGVEVARQLYYPYGEVRYGAGSLPTDFGYTGQRDVPSTGLMYYRARFYHPALGRFVSADTIVPEPGQPQDFNRYAYVDNNPVLYIDPSGHTKWKPPSKAPRSENSFTLPILPGASWAATVVRQVEEQSADRALSISASYQGLWIGISWFLEVGDVNKVYGPDEPLTMDVRHDPAVEQFRDEWASRGYPLDWCWEEDSIDTKGDIAGSFIDYGVEHVEAVVALLGLGSIEGRFDTVGIAFGSFDRICAYDDNGVIRIEVTNTSNWASFLRTPGMEDTFGIDIPTFIPRSAIWPGGNMYERLWWYEMNTDNILE